jgi:NAD-specific glutamate dehydrogenase
MISNWKAETPQFGMSDLWRLTIWGGLATIALFAAVLSIQHENAGAERLKASITSGQGTKESRTSTGEFEARPDVTTEETRLLAEAVRNLLADNDQLLTRIAALERNLDGITGAIRPGDRRSEALNEAELRQFPTGSSTSIWSSLIATACAVQIPMSS